jgi:hypothetical protein
MRKTLNPFEYLFTYYQSLLKTGYMAVYFYLFSSNFVYPRQ